MASLAWTPLWSFARGQVGIPYLYGGSGPSVGGYDCSGFTQAVYLSQGLNIGRDTSAQLAHGSLVGQDGNWALDMQNIAPGDLIFYGRPGAVGTSAHVVMYIGGGQVIQAGGRDVNITSLFQSASPSEPFLGVRRYATVTGGPPAGAPAGDSFGPAGNTTAPSGTGASAGGAANTTPGVPNINDINQLDQYIRVNYPDEAWLLDVPEVRKVIEGAFVGKAGPPTDAQIKAMVQNTEWWKHTSQNMIKFLNMQHATPEELNFGDPGSAASQALAHVHVLATDVGLDGLPVSVFKNIALNSLKYGWNDNQIQANLGTQAWVHPQGGGVVSNDPSLLADLKASAGQYLMNPDDKTLNTYIQGLAGKTMTMATFQAYLAEQAKRKYPYMAEQITAGQTPGAIVDPMAGEAAQTMEVNKGQVNFISDPFYARILNFRPPPHGNTQQAARMMTSSEMDAYLRNSDQWSYTQAARDQATGMAKAIVDTFGKVAQ